MFDRLRFYAELEGSWLWKGWAMIIADKRLKYLWNNLCKFPWWVTPKLINAKNSCHFYFYNSSSKPQVDSVYTTLNCFVQKNWKCTEKPGLTAEYNTRLQLLTADNSCAADFSLCASLLDPAANSHVWKFSICQCLSQVGSAGNLRRSNQNGEYICMASPHSIISLINIRKIPPAWCLF